MKHSIIIIIFLASFASQSQTDAKRAKLVQEITSKPLDSTISWLKQNVYNDTLGFHAISLHTLLRVNKTNDALKKAEVHTELANWHGYNGLFSTDSTVHHMEKALSYHLKGDDETKIADTYRALSIDYINAGNLDKAQDVLFKAIKIYESLKDEKGLGGSYRSLGVLYEMMGQPKKSIEYSLKGIPLLEKTQDYYSLAITQFNLIKGYGAIGQYEKAYKATEYCIELVKTKVPEQVFIPMRAHSYRGEVYVLAGNYEKALQDFVTAWEICVSQIGEDRCATYRTEIGKIYLLQKKYAEALPHLSVGVKSYEEKGQMSIIEPYLDLATTYEKLGNYKDALQYRDKAHANVKQNLEQKVANLETETVVKYETGKKDEAIAAQSILLAQKNKVQSLIIGIAGLLLLLLFLLFYLFRKNKKTTQVIAAKNAENELLLKEIHHRVKNNLEMVKSLIALQSAKLEDSEIKEAMIASQNRVQSMGIIHQKLYQGENLGSIEMKDYFINLSEGILDSYNAEDTVKIKCAMENLELDVDTAIPIGLIVNELLTNALKYAFPEDKKGEIIIQLSKQKNDTLTLEVSDNGVGKTTGEPIKGTGFGTQLIQLLTQQLNGVMNENEKAGTSVSFQFKLDSAA